MATHLDPVAWKKKKKIIITVSVIVGALLIIGLTSWLLLRNWLKPTIRYAKAEKALSAGNTEEAIEIFKSLGTYRDANDRAAELAFSAQKDDALERMLKSAKVGDIVTFGRYEQDNNLQNGPEPIRWLVLAERDGRLLLWSVDVLDHAQYSSDLKNTTWENCTLRTWLNDTFYQSAFTGEERLLIPITEWKNTDNSASGATGGKDTEDRVSILSFDELLEYGIDNPGIETIAAYPSAYAVAQGVERHDWYGTCKWWMRTPGIDQTNAVYCDMVGQPLYTAPVNRYGNGVRPLVWVVIGNR